MEHDCATRTVAGTTLVTVRLRNEAAVPRRVRVRNELPGPVLPPRREGVPERGWDEEGFTGVVAANSDRTLGYACPATTDRGTPVAVDSLGRAADDEDDSASEREAETVRSLGRARPPADAVPPPPVDSLSPSNRSPDCGSEPTAERAVDSTEATERSTAATGATGTVLTDSDGDADAGLGTERGGDTATDVRRSADAAGDGLPRSVDSWLSAVEARVERAERLTDATADEAASVLESTAVAGLPAAVAADERALRSVADRAAALADRASATDAEPVVRAVGDL